MPYDHEHSQHHGKAMIIVNNEAHTVELTMECVSCGTFFIKVPMVHIRSAFKILNQVADSLGLPEETSVVESQGSVEVDSYEEVQRVAQEFARMDITPPWVNATSKQSDDGNWD